MRTKTGKTFGSMFFYCVKLEAMAGKAVNRETAMREVVTLMQAGHNRQQCLSIFEAKWQVSVRTFDRYWKHAKEIAEEAQQAVKKELVKQTVASVQRSVKRAILNKEQRLQIASEIAMGKAQKRGKEFVYPTFTDRVRALDFLAKVDGDYKPELALAMQVNNTTNQTTNNTSVKVIQQRTINFNTRKTTTAQELPAEEEAD